MDPIDNTYINANDLLDAAKDHYWDSLEHERELNHQAH
jgi:hypothetical protein